jgi:hypothetical protein
LAKLVAIGDSLTQGFMSGAISATHLSYPAILARCMGLSADEFRVPPFFGEGGLPLNLEHLLDRLEERYGKKLDWYEKPRVIFTVRSILDRVEDYWERGPGSKPIGADTFHNLAVWGFEVADAYEVTPALCRAQIGKNRDDFLAQVPSAAMYRTALRVLNPARKSQLDDATQVSVARRIAQKEGIENLIVALGANNALGTVLDLKVMETGKTPPKLKAPKRNEQFNLWHPDAFALSYAQLGAKVAAIGAQRVFVSTVPHVTIPPVTRGINRGAHPLAAGERYFDSYARFFVKDANFTKDDPHLTKAEAQQIDSYINAYNDTIRKTAKAHGWHVVDMCALLDQLAYRRNNDQPKYKLPKVLADLKPPPDARFFQINQAGQRTQGGIFSLDGVHPTTIASGLMAQEFAHVMRQAGVSVVDVDFARLLALDTLVTDPPQTLDDVYGTLQTLEEWLHLSRLLALIAGG